VKPAEYTPVAKALHWLIALLIFVLFPLGWIMGDLTGLTKFQAYNLHKSLGFAVLLLTVLRLFWRFFNPVPELPASVPDRQKRLAHALHHSLYFTVFLLAMSGWATISTSDKPSVLFQVTPFPLLPWLHDLPSGDRKFYHEIFEDAHGALGWVVVALLALHIAAALYHGIVLKDGIFSSMRPNFGKRSASAAFLLLATGALSLGGGQKALASDWTVKPAESQIGFEASGGGYTTKGTFGQYRAEIEFDPDTPAQASVRVLLDMNSAATGTAEADDTIKSADFFNPTQFPTAQFVARGAQPAGPNKYVLNGRLTLKGVTRPVSLPFSLNIKSGTAHVVGETTINRLDFGVGPETVAGLAVDKDVKLSIDLTAIRLDD
jgi:cytochrome b561/polyisoprenoid-binding protein YceI